MCIINLKTWMINYNSRLAFPYWSLSLERLKSVKISLIHPLHKIGKKSLMKSLSNTNFDHLEANVQLELHDYQSNTIYNLNLTTGKVASPLYSILVYDISNLDSFNFLKSVPILTTKAFLIGNKLDLQRQVTQQQAQELALAQGYMFSEVSSVTRKNIEMVLKMITG